MRVTPGAIPLLEEAVHLLRRAPLATLVCHLVGTRALRARPCCCSGTTSTTRTPPIPPCARESWCWRCCWSG